MSPAGPQLSDQQMIEIPESAFLPESCVAEFSDYRNKFGFAVYPSGHDREVCEKSAALMRNATQMKQEIESIRSKLAQAGVKLDDWTFPEIQDTLI